MILYRVLKGKIFSNLRRDRVIYLIIILNLFIVIPLAYYITIGMDEAYSLNTSSQGISYAFKTAINFENQPPFYFVTLTIWRICSDTYFWARLFSVFSISLTIYVSAILSRELIPQIHPGWVCTMIAFNPFVIWAGIELRVYAFTLLLSVSLLLFFYKAYFSGKSDPIKRIIYISLSVIALNTYYYLGFILVANAIVLLAFRRGESIKKYLIDLIIPLCSIIYLLLALPHQITYQFKTEDIPFSFRGDFMFIFYRIEDYLFSDHSFYIYSYKDIWFDFTLIGFAFLILWKNLRNFVNNFVLNPESFLVGIITLLLFILTLHQIVIKEFLVLRHTSFLFIPLVFSVYSFLSLKPKFKILVTWSVFILIMYSITLFGKYHSMEKNEDAKRIATYIMSNESKNQPILVFRNEIALSFQVHYKGENQIVPIPRPINFEEPYDHNLWILHNRQQVDSIFQRFADSDYFWLISTPRQVVFGVDFNQEILEDYISEKFFVISRKEFFWKMNVRFLKRKKH